MKTAVAVALLAVGWTVSCATPSRADVEISQTTVIDAPGVKAMLKDIPETSRAGLLKMMSPMLTGVPWVSTTYLKGSKMRTDMGETTVVVNAKTGNAVTMDRHTKKYSIGPYDPFQKTAGDIKCHIEPTSVTSKMFGHVLHKYMITMTASVLPKSTISGEMWAASDMPAPPSSGYSMGPAAGFEKEMAKVKGMPLAYKITYHNTPAGDIKVTSYATAIKEDKIAANVFLIPSDFVKGPTRMASGMPSTGFPLGDGMPLDSMSPVTDQMATGEIDQNSMAGLLGGAGGGDMSQLLGSMSPADLQKILGSLSGGSGGASALGGMSPAVLQQLLSGLQGGAGGDASGGLAGLVNPEMLQQLSSGLQSLMQDDDQP